MLGVTIAFNPALTFHLFKGVLVAFPSSKLSNYGAILFSLRERFPEQFKIVQNSASCQSICSNSDKAIYIVEGFYSFMRQYELQMIFEPKI